MYVQVWKYYYYYYCYYYYLNPHPRMFLPLISRESGREGRRERERNKYQHKRDTSIASHMCPYQGPGTCN